MKPVTSSILALVCLMVSTHNVSFSHCDTMNGPVVIDAQKALESGNVTPILKWVKKSDEPEVIALFKKTVSVRAKGADIREIADKHFFETVVRIHRASEGEPFTGLKDSAEPALNSAEHALETNTADGLINKITEHLSNAIRQRFSAVSSAKKNADKSIDEGRAYVAAYVDFIHFVDNVYVLAIARSHGHGEEKEAHKH